MIKYERHNKYKPMRKFSIINMLFKNLYLLYIFLLAFVLRFVGTYPGYFGHPDEPKIYDATMNIFLKLNFQPIAFYYGSLLPIVYALTDFIILPFYIIYFVIFNIGPSILNNDFSILECFSKNDLSFCFGIQSSNFFLYLTRYETAFLSSFSTILIYFLSKKLFNKNIGLLAALFTAINYRHILSSHFTLADAPLTVFILISILLSLRIIKKPSLYYYMWAGFGLGLTFSVKYFVYPVFTLLLCHFLSKWEKTNYLVLIWRYLTDYKLYTALAIAVITFSLINPYLFLDTQNVKEQFELNSMFYGVSHISLDTFFNLQKIPLFSLYYLTNYGLGIPLTFATLIGLFLSAFKYPTSTFILLSVIFPFFYVFLIVSGNTYVRNYSSILPLLTIFPAVLIYEFTKMTVNSKLIACIICIILIYSQLKNSIILSYNFAQTNNYKHLEEWILKSLPDNSNAVKSWGTPFPGRKQVNLTDWDLYSTSYQSLSELSDMKVDWLILSSESGIYINHFLNLSESQWILKKAFFNENVLWKFLEDNYVSLLTRELASYRVKEFIKPFESLDPSFVVIKIPYFDETDLKLVSSLPQGPQINSECFNIKKTNESILQIKALKNNPRGLQPSQIILGKLLVKENKLYKVTGEAMLNSKVQAFRSKFLRIDFLSGKGEVLKTIVSSQLKGIKSWENISALGISPQGSVYAKISFQLDECRKNENDVYLLKNVQIFESNKNQEIDTSIYPYYNQQLSKSFIWLPPL